MTLPSFVNEWLGSYRKVSGTRLDRGVYLFGSDVTGRGVIVRGENMAVAVVNLRRFVSEVDRRTDRRRTWWFYT